MGIFPHVHFRLQGIFPYSAINFLTYDSLKRYFVPDNRRVGVVESLFYGGFAGATAQTSEFMLSTLLRVDANMFAVTYPVDLLRRRMQLQGLGGAKRLYSGPIDAVRKIVAQDGISGLYKGMIACYLKVCAIVVSACASSDMFSRWYLA